MTATSPLTGLTDREAEARLRSYGYNECESARRPSRLAGFFGLFLDPLAIVLLFAAAVSGFLGEKIDATIIAVIVLLGATINFIQSRRSAIAIESLRAQVQPAIDVLRENRWLQIPHRLLVPGDIIRLTAGDLVPADSVLLTAEHLHVLQGALTGESFPAEKEAAGAREPARDLDRPWMIFLGSSVISGSGIAKVCATGSATVFGDIAARLATRAPETEFERGIRDFGSFIMRTVFFLVLSLLVVRMAMRGDAFQSLIFAVSLAVGLTPEFLPMIASVTLATGAVRMSRRKVIVRHLAAIQNLGSMDVLCSDKTGTLTEGVMKLERIVDPAGTPSDRALFLAGLNSRFDTGIRSPLDVAIIAAAPEDREKCEKLDEIPFDFERRLVSVVLSRDGNRLMITKGAPEPLLDRCGSFEAGGRLLPFTPEAREGCRREFQELSSKGFRVLGVAARTVPPAESYGTRDESELCFAGFLAFADPPLADAAEMVEALSRDGVRFKVITGDNELVTRYICDQVGLRGTPIVCGSEIESMTDPALGHIVETTDIFARVSPAQKNRIILALKRRGHVVGYIGDGVNDAPSLHTADVGISVPSAADVAREAAEIILTEHGLDVLHAGILEGRRAFGNVMKYILMGTSSNFGNVLSMAAASVLLPFLPMLPTQILLNNFLYDSAQISIPTDHVDASWIAQPRRWKVGAIRRFMLWVGPVSSLFDFLTFYVLLHFLHAGERVFQTGWFVESLATQTLVLLVIRTAGNPFRSGPSKALLATTLTVVVIGFLLPFSPAAPLFAFTPLPAVYFAFLIPATAMYLTAVSIVRRLTDSATQVRTDQPPLSGNRGRSVPRHRQIAREALRCPNPAPPEAGKIIRRRRYSACGSSVRKCGWVRWPVSCSVLCAIQPERKEGNTLRNHTGVGRSIGMLFGGVAAGIVGTRLLPPVIAAIAGWGKVRAGADPFDRLIGDHRRILSILDRMLEVRHPSLARRARLYMMLKRRLAKHALAEEDVVYPLVHNDSATEERSHLYQEHAEMKILLHEAGETVKSGQDWTETLGKLRSLIREHVEEEEKTVFPELRRELSRNRWPALSGQISREEAVLF
ncbi:MAG TPA: magnesium-translocating P-type ATPase [Bryobacteraceae bacterium]|nr:magnesium-translocating P-type ATPase [Bryobacteraceae bacterium]